MEEENKIYQGPVVDSDILFEYETSEQRSINLNYADNIKEIINNVFLDFDVDASITGHIVGPNVIRFSLRTGKNVSLVTIKNLITDMQVRLGGVAVRLDTASRGMLNIGLEVPNKAQETVAFKTLYESLPDIDKYPLAIPLGASTNDEPVWIDLKDAPNILVCGTNGSGMSLFMNSVVTSLIMRNSPHDVKLILLDPNMVEFNRFNDMPHLYCPILWDSDAIYRALHELVEEMNDRYYRMLDYNCCCLEEYNEYAAEDGCRKQPYIVVCIDNYDNLVKTNREIANFVLTLAQKGKAVGIHLIVGIKNPSTKAVTGALKTNFPVRVGLMMASAVDSMTILGESGAEKLIGKGDMLIQSHLISKSGVVRMQGCFIHRSEIRKVVDLLKKTYPTFYFGRFREERKPVLNNLQAQIKSEDIEDNRYEEIKKWVLSQEYISISRIQRECQVGFNRASQYFLRLQIEGIVGDEPSKHGHKVLSNKEK